jgi:hypothetical protein
MRNSFSRFASSFSALLVDRATVIDADDRTETIRNSLLTAIHEIHDTKDKDAARLRSTLSRAVDIETLWYLRPDVLKVLSCQYGETVGRKQIDSITMLFRGVVPDSQMPVARRKIRS